MNDKTKELEKALMNLGHFVNGCYAASSIEYKYAFEAIANQVITCLKMFRPDTDGIMEIKFNVE